MRQCGDCLLCCKLERIDEVKKPRGKWCDHCTAVGCAIYSRRPKVCRDFQCAWLAGDLPEEFRPDRVNAYVRQDNGSGLRVVLSDGQPDKALLSYLSGRGQHVLVMVDRSLTFVPAEGVPAPEQIVISWVL